MSELQEVAEAQNASAPAPLTAEQKADKIIINLIDRGLEIDTFDDDIQEEIRTEIASIINE